MFDLAIPTDKRFEEFIVTTDSTSKTASPSQRQGHVLLMTKNGIGFGHLRRATLIAQAVARSSAFKPVIVSQAHSVRLLAEAGVHAINFPQLHRCSHVLAEDAYNVILDEVVRGLAPVVAVQDTYPDSRYSRLKALAGVRQLLVMRRVDSMTLDSMIRDGSMARCDEILVCQTRDEFDGEHHSARAIAVVEASRIFKFVGPVWRHATTAERLDVRRRYARDGRKLVVVSVGAGGDKYLDAFARRLIDVCIDVARNHKVADSELNMVIVTGPYLDPRQFSPCDGVAILAWEPSLHALLAEADVAVIKPGSNCLLEALDGNASLVLVPDRSYREGLTEHVKRIAERYGAAVVTPPSVDAIGSAIRGALAGVSKRLARISSTSGADLIASRIVDHAGDPLLRQSVGLPFGCVSLESGEELGLPDAVFGYVQHDSAPNVGFLTRIRGASRAPQVILADGLPTSEDSAADLVRRGARLIASLQMGDADALDRWRSFHEATPELLVARLEVFHWVPNAGSRVRNWLNRLALTAHRVDGAVLLVRSADELSAVSAALLNDFGPGTHLPPLLPFGRLMSTVARDLLLGR